MNEKNAITIEKKHNEPITIHFNYSGECQRSGDGSRNSLENTAKSLAYYLTKKLNKEYHSKYRFVSSEIMSLRRYEIRRKGIIPVFIEENLFRWGGFKLLFDSNYSEFNHSPNVIASLDANYSSFPLIINGNASKEERKIIKEWNKKRNNDYS